MTASACNWLLRNDENARLQPLCRSCRLDRTVPDPTDRDSAQLWLRVENAKRALVSQLIALRLPVASRVSEDTAHGVAFDLLRAPPGGPRVLTGHADGIITLDIEEADDVPSRAGALDDARALPHADRPPAPRDRALLLAAAGRWHALVGAVPRAVRR
jgi:hypothetical protein